MFPASSDLLTPWLAIFAMTSFSSFPSAAGHGTHGFESTLNDGTPVHVQMQVKRSLH
jgi:hypothetical protein